MERFRLRVRQEAKRGQIIELHMFPNMPGRSPREADARIMGSSSSPETVQWLRQASDPYLRAAEEPGPILGADFRPGVPPRWLRHEDGTRLALAFASARYLTKPAVREMFRKGLEELPAELVLYWFTLCFYGYRQLAGRAALRTLLTYEQHEEKEENTTGRRRKKVARDGQRDLFGSGDQNGKSEPEAGSAGGSSGRGKPRRRTHAAS